MSIKVKLLTLLILKEAFCFFERKIEIFLNKFLFCLIYAAFPKSRNLGWRKMYFYNKYDWYERNIIVYHLDMAVSRKRFEKAWCDSHWFLRCLPLSLFILFNDLKDALVLFWGIQKFPKSYAWKRKCKYLVKEVKFIFKKITIINYLCIKKLNF